MDTGSGDVTASDVKCGKKAWVKGAEIVGLAGAHFSDNGNGTVTDANTGLVWLKNANCFGKVTWQAAMDAAAVLADGQCGLTDGSTAGQWRLAQEDSAALHEWRDLMGVYHTTLTSNPGLPIPDAGPEVTDSVFVTTAGTVRDVNVSVTIPHSYIADILLWLEHDGVVVWLKSGWDGCDADNLSGAVFDDEGTGGSIHTCTDNLASPPNYVPDGSLASF